MKRFSLALLAAAVLACVLFTVTTFATSDYSIDRRAVISCADHADAPYLYYSATTQTWHCSSAVPVVYNGATLTVTAAELNKLAGVTAGTATASKGLVVDANKALDTLNIIAPRWGAGAGTLLTLTAAEANALHGVTSTAAEINTLHGVTAGTALASKALVVDANIDITAGLRNLVASGDLKAATFHVGATAGIDKTCGGPVISATFTKGILTAMTCTSEPMPDPATLVSEIQSLRQQVTDLRALVLSGGSR